MGLVALKINQNILFAQTATFFSGLTTAQAVDPLPLYRDFPVPSHQHLFQPSFGKDDHYGVEWCYISQLNITE
jgi:hypothetical protein